jgi:hypothetical protein
MAVTFLATLNAGILGVLAIAPLRHIAVRYLRTVSTLAIALAVATAVWAWLDGAAAEAPQWLIGLAALSLACALALFASAGSAPQRAGPFRVAGTAGFLAGMGFAIAWGAHVGLWPTDSPLSTATAIVGQTIGAIVLGSVTVSWLLGHAYLTATGMPIDPLRTLSNVFYWATLARVAWVVTIATLVLRGVGGEAFETARQRLISEWLIASMRGGVGLVLLLTFALMVRGCVRVRNTQSATGILYFASVTAYVGELSNLYLVRQTGIGF